MRSLRPDFQPRRRQADFPRDLADLLVDTAGEGAYEVREYPADRKKIDIGDYYADDSRLRSLLGWEPRTQLRDGLRQIIDYYRPRLQDYL